MNINTTEPVDLLPRWAYTREEWQDILDKTVFVKDNIRYFAKSPKQQESERIDMFIDDVINELFL
jgi:hypothetical protein